MPSLRSTSAPSARQAAAPPARGAPVNAPRGAVQTLRAGCPARRGPVLARARLARLLWDAAGERRVPSAAALDRALAALPRGELAWLCEFNPLGPVYLLPTPPFVRALAARIRETGARRVLEVAAGDGLLTRALARAAPDLEVVATDSGAWESPRARMSAAERRELRGQQVAGLALGSGVRKLEARAAIRAVRPDLVLACWLPPGPALARLIRAPVRYVLEIGAGAGVTGDASCWRFPHEFCGGPLEARARCRLDERPARALHTQVTLYLGAAHPAFRGRGG